MIMEGKIDGMHAGVVQKHDFSERRISLRDYIELKGLTVGDLIILQDDGAGVHTILVGNATPHKEVRSLCPDDGWEQSDYNLYGQWYIKSVYHLYTGRNWLSSGYVSTVADIISKPT